MSYEDFTAEIAQVNDILSSVNLLAWDARTQMPRGGAGSRAYQTATLVDLAREKVTGERMQGLLARAEDALGDRPAEDLQRRALEQARMEIDRLRRIPSRLISQAAELGARAHGIWAEARAANDFAAFAPVIRETFAIQREMAEALGYGDHPYDALVARYEPEMTRARRVRDARGAARMAGRGDPPPPRPADHRPARRPDGSPASRG
ncbi:carboxypeptidase M32 [Thioclava sp. BHET1]|nr:carboxypeptidase M32 [Thioclava sp. BHET1]